MKDHTPFPNSWIAFCTKAKELSNRELSDKDYKVMMSFYVNGEKVEEWLIDKQSEENK
jgi:hypothetical protein